MDERRGRIFIEIYDVLVNILHDKLVGILRHPRVDEATAYVMIFLYAHYGKDLRGQVEQGISIQSRLVVQKLVRGFGIYASLRHRVFGHVRGIFIAPPRLVEASARSSSGVLSMRVVFAFFNERFCVD